MTWQYIVDRCESPSEKAFVAALATLLEPFDGGLFIARSTEFEPADECGWHLLCQAELDWGDGTVRVDFLFASEQACARDAVSIWASLWREQECASREEFSRGWEAGQRRSTSEVA